MADKTRVAILGGGMASLVAAWELAQGPEAEGYEIHIYQRDWRLGGKCASGRSSRPDEGDRVEEHGIHVLPGFYENTFHVLKQVYEAVRSCPADRDKIQPWEDALAPQNEVVMADLQDGRPRPWKIEFPKNLGQIGGAPSRAGVATLYVRGSERYREFRSAVLRHVDEPRLSFAVRDVSTRILEVILRLLLETALSRLTVAIWLAALILGSLQRTLEEDLDRTHTAVARHLQLIDVRKLWIAAWFAGTNLLGLSREELILPPRDFLALDDEDYMDWMRRHSAVPVPNSAEFRPPPIQALYDLAFSHEHSLAAGTTLWVILHMALDYKGSFIYEMNGGMGDVVFVPFYLALNQHSNVHFHFFHDVEEVIANEDRSAIAEITIRQNYAMAGSPLKEIDVLGKKLQCWPNHHLETVEPVDEFKRLRAGEDFDVVVLGISHGALAGLCPTLCENERFETMVLGLDSIQTQSVQLWLDSTPEDLGWSHGSSTLISFTHPFNSWIDMGHVLERENWPPGHVKALAYFSDELPEIDPDAYDPHSRVREKTCLFLDGPIKRIWPGFDWSNLYDPRGGAGKARLDFQYMRANVDASDRYVLCAAGTTKHRLEPGDSGFANLALAGDWVKMELNAGCVEAATLGGLGAARAIIDGRVVPAH